MGPTRAPPLARRRPVPGRTAASHAGTDESRVQPTEPDEGAEDCPVRARDGAAGGSHQPPLVPSRWLARDSVGRVRFLRRRHPVLRLLRSAGLQGDQLSDLRGRVAAKSGRQRQPVALPDREKGYSGVNNDGGATRCLVWEANFCKRTRDGGRLRLLGSAPPHHEERTRVAPARLGGLLQRDHLQRRRGPGPGPSAAGGQTGASDGRGVARYRNLRGRGEETVPRRLHRQHEGWN
mmetsp:Transcript_33035/g.65404  ORF Transcript_33035/g.65404 Transcript_33035/m.65404 type:complete len:235 (+) Transcript_33035:151-855(+)